MYFIAYGIDINLPIAAQECTSANFLAVTVMHVDSLAKASQQFGGVRKLTLLANDKGYDWFYIKQTTSNQSISN